MYSTTFSTDASQFDGNKLWDEILKAIVSTMPSQLFPLFKEVYGREYPQDTPIVLLGSETSSFQETQQTSPSSTIMDIALLVAGTDYYHLECQMKNNKEMVIRMFAYDVRFAITHSKDIDNDTGEITLHFPHSVVIYPEKNNAIPKHLQCKVVFPDNSEHIYKIPTVRIQTYSLEEIRKKHLTLFIPYTILQLRPKLSSHIKHKLTQKGLTEFVEEVIFVLNEELSDGYLTEQEYFNYIKLFQFAVDKVLTKHTHQHKEVKQMTEPFLVKYLQLIPDPKVVERELQAKDAEISRLNAEIQRLQELVASFSSVPSTSGSSQEET